MKKILVSGSALALFALLFALTPWSPKKNFVERSAAAQMMGNPGEGEMACPMCGRMMGHGMGPGMGQGMGMMGHPFMDPKTTIKATPTADGVTVTLTNPDKTEAQQLQRFAQILVLRHEIMRTYAQQQKARAGTPQK